MLNSCDFATDADRPQAPRNLTEIEDYGRRYRRSANLAAQLIEDAAILQGRGVARDFLAGGEVSQQATHDFA